MFLVGLTGGIASGKSSVLQVLQQLGCAVIDVDVIARHVVQPGYPAHRRIVEAFGTEVLLENGDIDRKALGDLIFNQPDRRHLLNAITHPEICREMTKETFKYFLRGYRYVILDVPLLFETKKLLKYMKHTVVVYCTSQFSKQLPSFTQFTSQHEVVRTRVDTSELCKNKLKEGLKEFVWGHPLAIPMNRKLEVPSRCSRNESN
ncbi:dephospho-CoA kinase domain-containing protein isoform X2 [Sus scrofa]|uniref:dephospho-CoA kinase domain-containing protein isoform X2 n=1 Tax=Sus scrofa TaxID=9823 RepID=UPI0003AE9E63|nr:dephospho-CoA kinase domain-containing protein isoform X2 [Sus scrofa]